MAATAAAEPGGGRCGLEDHGFLVIRALFFAEKTDFVFANFNGVAIAQGLALHGFAVDVGAVGAANIFDFDNATGGVQMHHSVLATDGKVVDHDVVVRAPPKGGALLAKVSFLDDDAVNRNDHFGHGQLLMWGCIVNNN